MEIVGTMVVFLFQISEMFLIRIKDRPDRLDINRARIRPPFFSADTENLIP
jgi:hypothetical protein